MEIWMWNPGYFFDLTDFNSLIKYINSLQQGDTRKTVNSKSST